MCGFGGADTQWSWNKKWHNSAPRVHKSMYISCAFSCLEVAYGSGWRILMSFHTELNLQRDEMGRFLSINVLHAQKWCMNICAQNSLPPLCVYRQGFCCHWYCSAIRRHVYVSHLHTDDKWILHIVSIQILQSWWRAVSQRAFNVFIKNSECIDFCRKLPCCSLSYIH